MKVRYFSCKEVSEMTGKRIRTVWKWCNSGKLKASRPGGREYLIRESDLQDFLDSDNRTTTSQNQ